MIDWMIFSLIGVIAGMSAGLLGLGGGLIVVPSLLVVFHWHAMPELQIMHVAVGTSLMTITITSLSSMYAHQKYNNINWADVQQLAPPLIVGSLTGAFLATMTSSQLLQYGFAVYALLAAINLLTSPSTLYHERLSNKWVLRGFGYIVGCVSAMIGIGGGTFIVPYLNRTKDSIRRAIGTSSACGFPISVAAVIGFVLFENDRIILVSSWQTGFIHWQALFGITTTSMIAAPVGAKVAKILPVMHLRQLFSLALVLVSIFLLSR